MSRKHVLTAYAYDKRGKLLAVGHNSYTKSHPLQKHFAELEGKPNGIFLHAEIAALIKCGDKIPYKLSIERYYMDGTPALAAPCKICRAAIKAFGVTKIEYTI